MSSIIFNNNSSSPAVAGAGKAQIYAKSDGKVYKQVASDAEIEITDLTTVSTAPELSANSSTAKAWVNWTQVSTQTVRDSFNVSGISDEGVGRTTINFVHNFNTHDSWVANSSSNHYGSNTLTANTGKLGTFNQTCSSIEIYINDGGGTVDSYWCHFVAYGKNNNPIT
tara:strand:+ start:210 stop:713 length:504 start_codon:yes stop_codon:yes gene_type:complete